MKLSISDNYLDNLDNNIEEIRELYELNILSEEFSDFRFNKSPHIDTCHTVSKGIKNLLSTGRNIIFRMEKTGNKDKINTEFYLIDKDKSGDWRERYEHYNSLIKLDQIFEANSKEIISLDEWIFGSGNKTFDFNLFCGIILNKKVYFDEQVYLRKIKYEEMIKSNVINNNSYKWFALLNKETITDNNILKLDVALRSSCGIRDTKIKTFNIITKKERPRFMYISRCKIKSLYLKLNYNIFALNISNSDIEEINLDLTELEMKEGVGILKVGMLHIGGNVGKIKVWITTEQGKRIMDSKGNLNLGLLIRFTDSLKEITSVKIV